MVHAQWVDGQHDVLRRHPQRAPPRRRGRRGAPRPLGRTRDGRVGGAEEARFGVALGRRRAARARGASDPVRRRKRHARNRRTRHARPHRLREARRELFREPRRRHLPRRDVRARVCRRLAAARRRRQVHHARAPVVAKDFQLELAPRAASLNHARRVPAGSLAMFDYGGAFLSFSRVRATRQRKSAAMQMAARRRGGGR
mmetsp:Transcript_11910/g.41154  ORF Transcript_11910/g.41154 Transcript_11910/m.41154 type:complete len:200 (-) Transcript_11910:679-1278(-)